jgi:hypothetical protein
MAVCCHNLPLGALSSRSALSMLVGALFKKIRLFFEHALYVPSEGCVPYILVRLCGQCHSTLFCSVSPRTATECAQLPLCLAAVCTVPHFHTFAIQQQYFLAVS